MNNAGHIGKAVDLISRIWNPTGQALAAEFWRSKDGEKSGFSPVCRNRFDRKAGCTLGAGGGCRDCAAREHLSLTPEMVRAHVMGKTRHGVYPLLPGDVTAWIAVDLDNHDGTRDPAGDLRAILNVGSVLEIPLFAFSSNSGRGYHGYLFFQHPIPAFKVRSLMLGLVERAGVDISHQGDNGGSFDSVFPKSDSLKNGPGNLIALPWAGQAIQKRKSTLFLDRETLRPLGESLTQNLDAFEEAFTALAEEDVDALLKEMGLEGESRPGRMSTAKGREELAILIGRCRFLQHCRDDAATLPEPEWYAAVCILAREYGGPALIHQLSKPHPGYSYRETQEKIEHCLLDQPGPLKCATIRGFWDCGLRCGVGSPAQLLRGRKRGGKANGATGNSSGSDTKVPAADRPRPKESERLVELAACVELFHDPEGRAYGTAPVHGHRETFPLRGQSFRDWITLVYFVETGKPPGKQSVNDAIAVLEAKARFDGPECEVFLRVGGDTGAVFVDLANVGWEVVKITAAGWEVLLDAPVKFRRSPGMKALPLPERGGSLELLRPFLNTDADGFTMIIAWLVGCFNSRPPYPVLAIEGEAGTGKSGVARSLRALVDPATAPLRSLPKEERDLSIAAHNNKLLVFDNISGLSLELSDGLCRLATGSGFACRQLFTDSEEQVFGLARPVVMNGIARLTTRGDLLSRAVAVTLAPISPEARRTEAELQEAFALVHPRILGALFDAVSAALRNLPTIKLPRMLRLADFVKWVCSAEEVLPWAPGAFLEIYLNNASEAAACAIEADPLGTALCELLEGRAGWRGTAASLLDALDSLVDERVKRLDRWPKRPDSLSRRLRRLAPLLRSVGVEIIHLPRSHAGRIIELRREVEGPPDSSPSSNTTNEEVF